MVTQLHYNVNINNYSIHLKLIFIVLYIYFDHNRLVCVFLCRVVVVSKYNSFQQTIVIQIETQFCYINDDW